MRLDDVWLRYGRGPWVLCGITTQIHAGEAVLITGPNGAGKSTLLRLAAGLLLPDRGTVSDRPGRVGYVPERFPTDQPFTARHYLSSIAAVYGRADAADDIAAWADRLAFTSLLDRRLNELSKGSAQKVGLIQAMLGNPDLLVLDEPWEGLDAQTRERVPQIVTEVQDAGGRVLISDHLGQTADLPGLRRWELTNGRLREADGSDRAEWVVEVVVAESEIEDAVASLRAAGHQVVNVRGRHEPAT